MIWLLGNFMFYWNGYLVEIEVDSQRGATLSFQNERLETLKEFSLNCEDPYATFIAYTVDMVGDEKPELLLEIIPSSRCCKIYYAFSSGKWPTLLDAVDNGTLPLRVKDFDGDGKYELVGWAVMTGFPQTQLGEFGVPVVYKLGEEGRFKDVTPPETLETYALKRFNYFRSEVEWMESVRKEKTSCVSALSDLTAYEAALDYYISMVRLGREKEAYENLRRVCPEAAEEMRKPGSFVKIFE